MCVCGGGRGGDSAQEYSKCLSRRDIFFYIFSFFYHTKLRYNFAFSAAFYNSKEVRSDLHILTFETIHSSSKKDFKPLPEISHGSFEGAEWKEPAWVLNWAFNIILSKWRGRTLQ